MNPDDTSPVTTAASSSTEASLDQQQLASIADTSGEYSPPVNLIRKLKCVACNKQIYKTDYEQYGNYCQKCSHDAGEKSKHLKDNK